MATLSAGRALRALTRRGTGAAPSPPTPMAPPPVPPEERGGTLSPQQIRFFETFGFLTLPGLFGDDVERLTEGFEQVFAEHERMETREPLHFSQTRLTIPSFVKHSPLLSDLPTDPRVTGVVESLLGAHYVDTESDGNLFYCDTSWHPDTYAAPLADRHLKVSFYLDPLTGEHGAIRMMPGTNHHRDSYATALRRIVEDPREIEELLGVPPECLPAHTIESRPGDAVLWDFRTIHASFGGGGRRRLLSLNFKQLDPPAAA